MKKILKKEFLKKSQYLRSLILLSIYRAKSGHPGGSLSCADFLLYLFENVLFLKKNDFKKINRNYFILSKGHCAPTLYAIGYLKGFTTLDSILNLRKLNTKTQGHTDLRTLNWAGASTGSLGQGLSFAAGIALGLKKKKINKKKVFVVVGDGEIQEGQVWECLMFAAHHKLNNLVVVLDYNKIQSDNFNYNIMNFEPLKEKIKSFGLNVQEIDGHNFNEIRYSISNLKNNSKPNFIILNTIKGKGVSFMENKPEWHGSVQITEEQISQSLQELNNYKNLKKYL